MSAESNDIRQLLLEQLSSFEDRYDSKIDDVRMLADIQAAIGSVLGDRGASEAEIRRVLQERYDNGALRKETFHLVKSMLDRYVTEQTPTGPVSDDANGLAASDSPSSLSAAPGQSVADDVMSSTAVLPAEAATAPDSADARVQVGSVLRDRFMLQERMAGGSMGVVYKALDRRLAEGGADLPWVAVKVLSPQLAEHAQALRALQQEAAKGRCLAHPNIVRFIDLDRDDDLYFIVMEWLDGATLAEILDSPGSGNIDRARAFEIVHQIGKALEYAHRCGIVHADVKPGNIMIMPNGDAKLFDFGIARVRQQQLQSQPGFDPGVLGLMTPAYSSMQVLTGEEPTPADDVFSLACLLYRLVAGYRVFGPRNAAEAAEEGMKPQQPQGLGDAQWRVLKKALSYARVTRFNSMSEFIDALDVAPVEPITITVPARDKLDTDRKTPGAGRRVFGVLLLLGLLGGAAWHFGYLDELMERIGVALPTSAPTTALVSEPTAATETIVQANADEFEQLADAGESADDNSEGALAEIVISDTSRDDLQIDAELLPEPPVSEVAADTVIVDALDSNVSSAVDDSAAIAVDSDRLQEADGGLAEDETIAVTDAGAPAVPVAEDVATEETVEAVEPLVDFSLLPPPTISVPLAANGSRPKSVNVRLREDGQPVTVDLIRSAIEVPLTLRIEEVRYSGNRSPWRAGQFRLSDNGLIEFPAGQERARVTLSMTSDPVREADQQITLRVREVDSATSELAIITAVLEDDDQRVFEATLPANTVAFATSQVSVREQDPAVQIDVLRFNPDSTSLQIGFTLRDITATQGEDYFAPGRYSIEFGPYQRAARILIPLVQDSAYEDNEAFSIELSTADSAADPDIYRRIAVMIRDDDL